MTKQRPKTEKGAGKRSRREERKGSTKRNYIMAITQF